MIIKRQKFYSGYAEAGPEGMQYLSAQVLGNYVIDPIDGSLIKFENSRVGQMKPVRKKIKLVRTPIDLIKLALKSSENKTKQHKAKN